MFDRLLSGSLTMMILALISAAAGAGLFLLFLAWNDLLSSRFSPAGLHVIGALACLGVTAWLGRHREELADC